MKYLLFALAIICNALMDAVHFTFGKGHTFWSITTSGFDAWHIAKLGMWFFIIISISFFAKEYKNLRGKIISAFYLSAINLIIHTAFYHWIFKPLLN